MITEQQIQEFVKKLSDKYATPEDQFPRTYGYEILKRYARMHHNGETENTYEALLRFKFNNLFGCI